MKELFRLPSTGRIYVGIDVGKTSSNYFVVDGDHNPLGGGVLRMNSTRTFVRSCARRPRDIIVGTEATSSYYERLAVSLLEQGVHVRIINPQLTSTKTLRRSMRLTKTDATDALAIARVLAERRGEIGCVFWWDADKRAIQSLGRSIDRLKKMRQALVAHTNSYKDRAALAGVMAPDPTLLDSELMRLQTELIRRVRETYETEMTILDTIPGLGDLSSAFVLAECLGLSRFPSGRAFAAFAGLDPRVRLSGTSIHGRSSMTKNGSSILRRALGRAAVNVVRWNAAFRRRFHYDVERGKRSCVAYSIATRRLAVIMHRCVHDDVTFDVTKVGCDYDQSDLPRASVNEPICRPSTP